MKLPKISGKDLIKLLAKKSFRPVRQRGSHVMLRREEPSVKLVTIPNHPEIARGTLRAILKQAGLSMDDLLGLYYKR